VFWLARQNDRHVLAHRSEQASIIYLTSFNSPTYSDGGLIGQDGWLITGTSVVNPISVSNTATNGFVSLVNHGSGCKSTIHSGPDERKYLPGCGH